MRIKDFQGFRFGKIHTSDLHLEVVSTSDRYEPRILPAPIDTTIDIPGNDGQYYFGSIYKNREITCNLAFDNVSEQDYRKIRQLFATDKLQDLVFDEEPYKTWKAKIKSKPEFKSLCFTDKETKQRVYKGTGKLVFICYYPYAFGFDKYIVRAADYYMLTPPECIIQDSYSDETYVKNQKNKIETRYLPEDINYHYNLNPSNYEGGTTEQHIKNSLMRDKSHRNKFDRNWEPNDKLIWKTGFPTTEQVQQGELFFDTPNGEKSIIDVRGYWDRVPEWESTAKLLYTPTLDFEEELMYLPQYSKTDFVNMELGFNSAKAMIGSRMLVYNPGDIPVDWEIRFDENKRGFWSCRGGTKFRISRFNVERLPIPKAVDWCGLTTYEIADNDKFKYGTKYFKRRSTLASLIIAKLEEKNDDGSYKINKPKIYRSQEEGGGEYSREEIILKIKQGILVADKNWQTNYRYYNKTDLSTLTNKTEAESVAFNLHIDDFLNLLLKDTEFVKGLGKAHPHYCYYVEPIPRQKLGHFIKLFYWQTIQWRGDQRPDGTWIATDRYKELAKDIIGENGKVQDMSSPLVNFLKYFANVALDGTITTYTESNDSNIHQNKYREIYKQLDFERGIDLANRYDELFSECITEEEEFELYWRTLKLLLHEFKPIIEQTLKDANDSATTKQIDAEINKFIDSYINHPREFINTDMRDLDFDNFIFNGYKMPEWITQDYIEIDQSALSNVDLIKQFFAAIEEDEDYIFSGNLRQYTNEDRDYLKKNGYNKLAVTFDEIVGIGGYLNDLLDDYYYLNSDTRMLYTTENPYGMEFVYKPSKVVLNDAIHKGKWFKLPPGWSLICVEPVVDESLWGGKRWEDSRPYDWGYGGDLNRNKREVQQLYDFVYDKAREEFFKIYPKDSIKGIIVPDKNLEKYQDSIDNIFGTEDPIDELLKFKVWYEKEIETLVKKRNYFAISYYQKLKQDGEYTFLKIINSIWSALSQYYSWTSLKGVYFDPDTGKKPQLDDYDVTGLPLRCINGDISDWWWYACNYVWANFPPLYWAMADMLNRLQIKYTPLFY